MTATTQRIHKVGVIIVTFNAREYLPECLESLSAQEYHGEWTTIIVDNNSTDDTVSYIASRYPNIVLIRNKSNDGFAKGNNIGIRKAFALECDAVILLNQDTIVSPEFVRELVRAVENDAKIGAAQSLIFLSPEKELLNTAGNELHYLGFGYTAGYRKTRAQYVEEKQGFTSRDIGYPSGAAVLFTKEALSDVGLFDEDLFMYHEDLDLGWRLHLRGFRIILAPKSIVWHKYSFTKSIAKYYYMERNRFIVLFKNYSVRTLLLLIPVFIVTESGLDLVSILHGYWRERLKAYLYFFNIAVWKKLIQKRRNIQKRRRLPDTAIAKFMTDRVLFQDVESPILEFVGNPLWIWYWRVVRRFI